MTRAQSCADRARSHPDTSRPFNRIDSFHPPWRAEPREVFETALPGVGIRYDFTREDGDRLGVVLLVLAYSGRLASRIGIRFAGQKPRVRRRRGVVPTTP
jgi:hypothetical protein